MQEQLFLEGCRVNLLTLFKVKVDGDLQNVTQLYKSDIRDMSHAV